MWVTYMSSDRDLRGVLLLSYNLRKVSSKYKLCCIVVENVSDDAIRSLEKHGIMVVAFNFSDILTKEYKFDRKLANFVLKKQLFGKYLFFKLEFDKKVYLNSDLLILRNIDELFDKEMKDNMLYMVCDMARNQDYSSISLMKNRFNTGVMLSTCDKSFTDAFFETLLEKGSEIFEKDSVICDLIDKIIFEKLKKDDRVVIENLDMKYNMHPVLIEASMEKVQEISILHYMKSPKPWEFLDSKVDLHRFENNTCAHAYKLWLSEYNEMVMSTYFGYDFGVTNIKDFNWVHVDNEGNQLVVEGDVKL